MIENLEETIKSLYRLIGIPFNSLSRSATSPSYRIFSSWELFENNPFMYDVSHKDFSEEIEKKILSPIMNSDLVQRRIKPLEDEVQKLRTTIEQLKKYELYYNMHKEMIGSK